MALFSMIAKAAATTIEALRVIYTRRIAVQAFAV
jgi:hypothetical protein